MRNKRVLLFDLDGTLTDPAQGITASIAYALSSFGINVDDLTTLQRFIGPPLIHTFEEYFPDDPDRVNAAIVKYREFYGEKGMLMNRVYDGMKDLLAALSDQGKTLLLATSKPSFYARQIMAHYGLDRYFTFLAGSNLDNTRVKKDEVIAWAMQNAPPFGVSEAVMIGDRKHDVLGARVHGMDAIGVLFGYGDRAELEEAGAAAIAATVQELSTLLLRE